jgi:hypothetical protein
MIEQRLSKINFIGEDGFHWFIGQVTVDPNWREFSTKYGYRAKVRILGRHPASNEVPDSELPWAHFLVPPNLGAGKNFGGTSFALHGGETVLGFFLDGDDMQQPVIMGALFSGQAEKNLIAWNDTIRKGTSGFNPIDFNKQLNYSTSVKPSDGSAPIGNGIPGGGKTADGRESIQGKKNNQAKDIIVGRAKKCKGGKGFMWEVASALTTFIKITRGLIEYKNGFIDPVLNQIVNISSLIGQTASLISGAFSQLIRLARKYMFQKIYNAVKDLLNFLLPDSLLKDIAVKKAIDTIFCLIENVIKGLTKFISDFLMQMLGKIVSIPLCAAEQFIAGLISSIGNQIQELIGPAMNSIQQILGPIGNFMGYIYQAVNYTQIGLNFLKCEGEICEPTPYNWAVNFGSTPQEVSNFQRSINLSARINNLSKDTQNTLGAWFPKDETGDEIVEGLVDGCNPYNINCGPPEVLIFGGGGAGAIARAVVNSFGQIVGVNMIDVGLGYSAKPYVQFIDNCDNGYGATGEAIVQDGQITNIVVDNPGSGYIPTSDVTPDSQGEDVVGSIEDIQIVNTGIGYTNEDLIGSDDNSVILKPQLDRDGRIIGADIVSSSVGLTKIPDLSINSPTGVGAIIRPVIRYVRRSELNIDVPSEKVIRVIDCVNK